MAYSVVDRRGSRLRTASAAEQNETVQLTLPARDFLFTQATICCSVMLEQNSYLIRPECSKFVNANGDGWSNESLKANYETYIGAFNFVNHVQIPDKSVGFIADAALRRVWIDLDQQIWIYYVDILVATARRAKRPEQQASFDELCNLILTNKIMWLSMGCDLEVSTCSACGNVAADDIGLCEHLSGGRQKGRSFIDRSGLKRITCELIGTAETGSCKFIEASWLTEPPASGTAVKRSVLPIEADQSVVVQMPTWAVARDAVQMWAGDHISG